MFRCFVWVKIKHTQLTLVKQRRLYLVTKTSVSAGIMEKILSGTCYHSLGFLVARATPRPPNSACVLTCACVCVFSACVCSLVHVYVYSFNISLWCLFPRCTNGFYKLTETNGSQDFITSHTSFGSFHFSSCLSLISCLPPCASLIPPYIIPPCFFHTIPASHHVQCGPPSLFCSSFTLSFFFLACFFEITSIYN